MLNRRSLLFVVSLLLVGVSGAIPLVTTSSSGRFRVRGADSAENTEYTRWAEDMATRLERTLGGGIRIPRGLPVEIVLDDSRPRSLMTASMAQRGGTFSSSMEGNPLKRTLIIQRSRSVDNDLLREGLVRLMLAGLVERSRREANLPAMDPHFPQWFIMGLAQNLDPEGLARNRKITATSGLGMDAVMASEVLGWIQLPEGWHSRQAVSGLLVAWILSFPGGGESVLDRVARQEPVTPEWLATKVVGGETVSTMDSLWRAWRQRQGRLIQEFGGLSSDMIGQLRRELPLAIPSAVSGSKMPHDVLLRPEEVIAARKKNPAAAMMAVGKIERIRIVTLGKAPELMEVGEQFVHFYEGVARGAWASTLKWRLARANAALDRLDQLTRARESYLDEVESEWNSQGLRSNEPVEAMTIPELEKSRIESYLDGAERRFHKP